MINQQKNSFMNTALALLLVSLLFYILSSMKDLLIPFIIAAVLWYLTIALANALQSLGFFKNSLSKKAALLLSILIGFGLFILILFLLSRNISHVIDYIPKYQANLTKMLHQILEKLEIKSLSLNNALDLFEKNDVVIWLQMAAHTLTDLISVTGIILVYYLFLLIETQSFNTKFDNLIQNQQKRQKARQVLETIHAKLQHYLWIKTCLSLLTAITSYGVLYVVGVDFAEFWAALIFLFNYIPTIGSVIATIFPCLLTLIQFSTSLPFIIVATALSGIQFLIGNLIEPRIIGGSFNLSGLVILISLVIWGKLWGLTGMFLCVPMTVMAYIIFSEFNQTQWIAVLLSANGHTQTSSRDALTHSIDTEDLLR